MIIDCKGCFSTNNRTCALKACVYIWMETVYSNFLHHQAIDFVLFNAVKSLVPLEHLMSSVGPFLQHIKMMVKALQVEISTATFVARTLMDQFLTKCIWTAKLIKKKWHWEKSMVNKEWNCKFCSSQHCMKLKEKHGMSFLPANYCISLFYPKIFDKERLHNRQNSLFIISFYYHHFGPSHGLPLLCIVIVTDAVWWKQRNK